MRKFRIAAAVVGLLIAVASAAYFRPRKAHPAYEIKRVPAAAYIASNNSTSASVRGQASVERQQAPPAGDAREQAPPAFDAIDKTDKLIINRAREISAAELDELLPNEPFELWLKRTLGSSAELSWETNDCGEVDGSGRQTSTPVCADAEAKLSDGRELSIWIVVGSESLETSGEVPLWEKPAVWWFSISSSSSADNQFQCRLRLRYLPEVLNPEVLNSSLESGAVEKWCGSGFESARHE